MHSLSANRLTPMQFVLTFGVVSIVAGFVYEGARAIGLGNPLPDAETPPG